jgi:hypothetical protein
MIKRPLLVRPFSLVTACVLGSAGAASAMTAMSARLFVLPAASASPSACEAVAAEAHLAGLQAFDRATAEYDQVVAREEVEPSSGYDLERVWTPVRDRYRLFLAYPEAVDRWPQLAEIARERATNLDELVENLAEMQRLERQAEELAERGGQ